MKEIRIHARAGQGAITSAALLAEAYALMGKYAFAFPHFGAARIGAPMNAFLRVDDKPIRTRAKGMNPDYLIIVDPSLAKEEIYQDCKPNAIGIVDSQKSIETKKIKLYHLPASQIAMEVMKRPLGNTVLLGAFAKITGEISLESLLKAIDGRFSGKVKEYNIQLAKMGYEKCSVQ